MRCFARLLAATALVAAGGACGSSITVPDQGVIVTGCNMPGACFLVDSCPCTRASVTTSACVTAVVCTNPGDITTCECPLNFGATDASAGERTQCLETAQVCVGRGAYCAGAGARCLSVGSACSTSGGDPPMLVPTVGMPTLEPHCAFVDDVCCPGLVDAGVTD